VIVANDNTLCIANCHYFVVSNAFILQMHVQHWACTYYLYRL